MPETDPSTSDDDMKKTVRLTDQDVRDAARLFKLLSDSEARPPPKNGISSPDQHAQRESLVKRARTVFEARQLRSRFFSPSIFGEPAWDVLLVLYIADASDARQTVGKLAASIRLPPSTVLRWVGYLEKERLVERQPHPTDRRVTFIRLLEKGRASLEAYMTAMPKETST